MCFSQTARMLELLGVFESGPTARLDLKRYYLQLLQRYGRELEILKETYQRQKDHPPIGRNLPPVQAAPSKSPLWSMPP